MEETVRRLAVLYADIAGSTRLYEQYGDEVARGDVAACLGLLAETVERLQGRVVKSIGDELMCVFADPVKAGMAGGEMHTALRGASEQGRFRTGVLRVKVGWHYGQASERPGDIAGEAPIIAQQIIRMAKPEEVLASAQTLSVLPRWLKRDARFVDRVEAETGDGLLEVYEIPWEEEAELTQVSAPASDGARNAEAGGLVLEHAGREYRYHAGRTHCRLGRSDENDVAVHGRFTSRHHAEIFYRHGRFHVRDNSTNGTVLVHEGDRLTRLHREEAMLSGSGSLGLGTAPAEEPGAAVRFRCE